MNDDQLFDYNRRAWDHQVSLGDRWTVPVDGQTIDAARKGAWSVCLTPVRAVPRDWFPPSMNDVRVLGLASGGGQQCPVFAAAGATVTSFDASKGQLKQDERVAVREKLSIAYEQGDMADLSRFSDGAFDLVFHPVSNCFVPDVRPVWCEVARVLKPGGTLLAGIINPVYFLFDDKALERGEFVVRYRVPYDDRQALDSARLEAMMIDKEPLCFGHTLQDQMGGALDAGLAMLGMYEDRWGGKALDDQIATFIAMRFVKT